MTPARVEDRVLLFIVDDDKLVLYALMRQLKGLGHEIEGFTSPEEAIAAAATRPPQLVIVDFNMTGITGLELVRKLREIAPRLRAMLVSGRFADQESAEAIASGLVDRFLQKPWHAQQLREALEALARAAAGG